MGKRTTPLDKICRAVDTERLNGALLETLEELHGDNARELGERLEVFSDLCGAAFDAVESWTCAEDREERADAKERALECLEALHSQTYSIPDVVLAALEDIDEEADDVED